MPVAVPGGRTVRRLVRRLCRPPVRAAFASAAASAGPEPAPDPVALTERRLLGLHPGLVRHAGHLAGVRDDLLSWQARDANLGEVAGALDAAGLDYALVPGHGFRHRLAIRPGDRAAVLESCVAAFADQPVYFELLGHGRELGLNPAEGLPALVAAVERVPEPEPAGAAEPAEPPEPERVKGLRVFRPSVTTGRTLYYGADHGCELEFWDADAEGSGAVASIDETPFGSWLPSLETSASVRIADRDVPVLGLLAGTFPGDIDFPIDAVITWVDDTDERWQQRRAGALAAAEPELRLDAADHRYRNRDELRYCLRSIASYAPWVRRIFLVTDDQVPAWLDTAHPGVTVVAHRELFADPGVLPVFNSHAIETQLHRIPGLAEHFLYFNDDLFLGRPVRPQSFFLGSGLPRVVRNSRTVPPGGRSTADSVYTAAQKNARAVLLDAFGRIYPQILSHSPYPLCRSLLAASAERFAAGLAATGRSVFRSAADLPPITLALYAAHATGQAVDARLEHFYAVTDRPGELDRLADLLGRRWADTFCLADGGGGEVPAEEQGRVLAAFLRDYFPVASPYELAPPAGPGSAGAAGPD
ncbi:stealth family protein [Kitasatospora sp. NPDC002040]|uniref:stealth family protein n=1 Tax=Kitasatospora sp. NPDC002040 TaxID=3154661 RepID=UPI003329E255